MPRSIRLAALAAVALAAATALPAHADYRITYEVTITNTTYNQRFTPLLLATHKPARNCARWPKRATWRR